MDKPYWLTQDPSEWSRTEATLERERARMERETEYQTMFHRHQAPLDGQPNQHRWVVENLLPRQYVMLLAGPPDAGKGCFTTALAKAVAKGDEFAGMKTAQGAVLWVAMEECFAERKELFNYDPDLLAGELDLWTCHLRHAPIDTDEGIECLTYWTRQLGNVNLIVIDPLYAAVSNCNLSEGHYARRAMQRLKQLAYERDLAVIVLHQLNRGKAQRIADSIQLQATASINAVFSRVPSPPPLVGGGGGAGEAGQSSDGGASRVTIKTTGRGMFANATHWFQSTGPLSFERFESPAEGPRTEPEKVNPKEAQVLAALSSGYETAATIAAATGLNAGTVKNTLNRLGQKRQIRCKLIVSRVKHFEIISNKMDSLSAPEQS